MNNKFKIAALTALIPLLAACGKNLDSKTAFEVPEGTTAFSITSENAPTSYTINGVEANPKLHLRRNVTYSFNVRSYGHPFYIMLVQNINPANRYNDGVTGNGVEVGPLTFTVPRDAPDVLYYGSSLDGGMTGILQID